MYNQHQQYHYTLVTIDTKLVGVNTPLGHPKSNVTDPHKLMVRLHTIILCEVIIQVATSGGLGQE